MAGLISSVLWDHSGHRYQLDFLGLRCDLDLFRLTNRFNGFEYNWWNMIGGDTMRGYYDEELQIAGSLN